MSELQTAALFFVEKHKASLSRGQAPDNQRLWSTLKSQMPELKFAPAVVVWYLSIQDGTAQLEREFGVLRKMLDEHNGPLLDVEELCILAFELPKNEEDIVRRCADEARLQFIDCCIILFVAHGALFSFKLTFPGRRLWRGADAPLKGVARALVGRAWTQVLLVQSQKRQRQEEGASTWFKCSHTVSA